MVMAGWVRVALIDLGRDFRKFTVLLACLALGVGIIAAVGSVGAALEAAVSHDARAILGGDLDATIGYRPATAKELALFKSLGEVSEVVQIAARASAGTKGTLLSLRAVAANYPLVGTVKFKTEVAPTPALSRFLGEEGGEFGAVVAPLLLDRLELKVGQHFRIGSESFVARALLVALPDAAAEGLQLGVPVLISDAALRATGLLQPGVLARYHYKIVLKGKSFKAASEAITKTFPDAGWQVRSPHDATANMMRYFNIFDRFLVLVGLSSLLVGGIGVSNAVAAYITDRQRSIATMASLGATGRRITVHFLIQVMVLVIAGTLIGLVLGGLTTLLGLPYIGSLLSLDLGAGLYPEPLATAGLFGVLIGFVFAYLPLMRARLLRPASLFRSAGGIVEGPRLGWRAIVRPGIGGPLVLGIIALVGLAMVTTGQSKLVGWYGAGAVGAFVLLRLVGFVLQWAIGKLPPLKGATGRLALRNISRPGAPTPTVMVSLGLGLTLMLVIALIETNVRGQLNGQISEVAPSFVFMNVDQPDVAGLRRLARTDPNLGKLEFTPFLRGIIAAVNGKKLSELKLSPHAARRFGGDRPLSWAAKLPGHEHVVAGKWWPDNYSGPPLLSLDEDLKAPLHLKVGDTMTMTISGRPIKFKIASFRHIDWHSAAVSFEILASPGVIQSAPATVIGTLKTPPAHEQQVQETLVTTFPTLAFIPVSAALSAIANVIGSLANAVALVGGLALVSAVFVIAGALAAGRRQREADAVLIKVLGATRGDIARAYLIEYGLLGALASVVAACLGTLGAWAMVTNVLQLSFSLDGWLVVWVVLGSVVVTIATGLLTTWSALSTRPARFLRAAAQ